MVGTQALFNVLTGERYKMIPKEIKDYVRGLYGKSPSKIDEEIKQKIIGDEEVITVRPADLIKPEFEVMKKEAGTLAKNDEDVLAYALFPQVAPKYLNDKYNPVSKEEEKIQFITVTM
jgi:oxaloacetate decarboxylase alpha subunit